MKSRFLTILLWAFLTALYVTGCSDDLRYGGKSEVMEGDISVSYTIEGLSLTRSDGGEGIESHIGHAYLLFYPSDASVEDATPLAYVRAEVTETNPSALKFKMPLQLQPDTDYRFIAVANADDYLPDGYGSFSDYLAAWSGRPEGESDKLCLYRTVPILARDVESLPMRGEVRNGAYFRYTIQNGGYQVSNSLIFRRMVARMDVVNIVKDGFTLEGVALCNWRDSATIFSDSNIGNVRGVLSESGENKGAPVFIEAEEISGFQQLQSAIYSFPSAVVASEIGDRESTALIIKAKYGDDVESSYYRINVGTYGSRAVVKANTKYLITVQSVNGRGAASPEEAYVATETQLGMSMDEDWDIDGGSTMDDYGNFIVLSRGAVEFDADQADNVEVRVLTSKGLAWNVEYIPADEFSDDAFTVSKVLSSIIISPRGENATGAPLSGICRVSALTPQGTSLTIDIILNQKGEVPVGPVIPWDMPFALVPLDGERVKIDQEAKTIEIDGFDPDCFNSFIDIPFQVYVNGTYGAEKTLTLSSTLEWPLEGHISKNRSADYTYCMNSFTSGSVSSSMGVEVARGNLHQDQISVENGNTIFLSIGAMGPDDPAIIRQIQLSIDSESIVYSLKLKPRSCIIDDVILLDASGTYWLIMDRNIQADNVSGVGRDHNKNGMKPQAYHYCNLDYMGIPFKYKDGNHSVLSESNHLLYMGFESNFNYFNKMTNRRDSWLQYYKYREGEDRTSPFYDDSSINDWIFPDRNVLGICGEKMSVSKMRMFLVSDVPAKDAGNDIPVCCYWPCFYQEYPTSSSTWLKRGYFISDNGSFSQAHKGLVYVYCGSKEVEIHFDWTSASDDCGLGRLVRQLTTDELEDYKNDYLGYGSRPLRLTVCHPDTYESTSLGWLPY